MILYSRKLGHLPLATFSGWETVTRKCVRSLEFLENSHFPRNYVSGDAITGKMPDVNIPSSSKSTLPVRMKSGIWICLVQPMRFESHFKSSFGNVKAFNLKKLKVSLSPSRQWPQAALRLGGDGRQVS